MNIHDQKITSMTRAETHNLTDAPADTSQALPAAARPVLPDAEQAQPAAAKSGVLVKVLRITLKVLLPMAVIAAGYFS